MSDWIVVQPSLDNITDALEPIVGGVSSVLEILIQTLNIAETTLNIIKAFTVGLLEPIVPLLKALIKEIQQTLSDLRNLGFYFHGDWNLLDPKNKFADIVGGYDGFESRMVTRLLNSQDPNRPDFSSSAGALAIYFYVSEGSFSTGIGGIVEIIKQIAEFFGQRNLMNDLSPYVAPIPTQVKYRTPSSNLLKTFEELTELPNKFSVSWSFPNTGGPTTLSNPAPRAYVIHISTNASPFNIYGTDVTGKIYKLLVDPITNKPLEWYGDIRELDFISLQGFEDGLNKIAVKSENTPFILLDDWIEGVFGKTYVVDTNFMTNLSNGENITSLLDITDLPVGADVNLVGNFGQITPLSDTVETYYVRIRGAVNPFGMGTLKEPKPIPNPIYKFDGKNLIIGREIPLAEVTSPKNFTVPSNPIEIKVPKDSQLVYKNALTMAISIVILSRPDFSLWIDPFGDSLKVVPNTVNLSTDLELLGRKLMDKYNIAPSLYKQSNPRTFCGNVYNLAKTIANDLINSNAPTDVLLTTFAEQIDYLNTFVVYKGETLLELLANPTKDYGIGGNPLGLTFNKKTLKSLYETRKIQGPKREPVFREKLPLITFKPWVMGAGSGDLSPVLFNLAEGEESEVIFFLNFLHENKENSPSLNLISASKALLNIGFTSPLEKDKGWIAVNFLQNMVPEAEEFLITLEEKALSVLGAFESAAEQIEQAILTVQERINALETLLQQLDELLNKLLDMSLPQVSALVTTTSNGTSGLVNELINSTNKPTSSSDERAAGAVLVAGGIPLDAVEFLLGLITGE